MRPEIGANRPPDALGEHQDPANSWAASRPTCWQGPRALLRPLDADLRRFPASPPRKSRLPMPEVSVSAPGASWRCYQTPLKGCVQAHIDGEKRICRNIGGGRVGARWPKDVREVPRKGNHEVCLVICTARRPAGAD